MQDIVAGVPNNSGFECLRASPQRVLSHIQDLARREGLCVSEGFVLQSGALTQVLWMAAWEQADKEVVPYLLRCYHKGPRKLRSKGEVLLFDEKSLLSIADNWGLGLTESERSQCANEDWAGCVRAIERAVDTLGAPA